MNLRPVHVVVAGAAASGSFLALAAGILQADHARRTKERSALVARLDIGQSLQTELLDSKDRARRTLDAATAARQEQIELRPLSAVNEALGALTSLAAEYHLDLDSLVPAQPQPRTFYTATPLAFRGRATFPDVVDFLEALHNRMPDIGVVSLALEGGASSANQVLSVSISLEWRAASDASDARTASAPTSP